MHADLILRNKKKLPHSFSAQFEVHELRLERKQILFVCVALVVIF